MALFHTNGSLQLSLDLSSGVCRFTSQLNGVLQTPCLGPALAWAHTPGGRVRSAVVSFNGVTEAGEVPVESPLGTSSGWHVRHVLDGGTIQVLQSICPGDSNSFLCRLEIRNPGPAPIYLEQISLLSSLPVRSCENGDRATSQDTDSEKLRVFINGWQSWSPAGSCSLEARMPQSRFRPFVNPMHDSTGRGFPREKGHFVSDLFGVVGAPGGAAVLIGFLSQTEAFGQLEIRKERESLQLCLYQSGDLVRLDPGGQFKSDWALVQALDLACDTALDPYLDLYGRVNHARSTGEVPAGWSSWYQYFQKIGAHDVLENVSWLSDYQERLKLHLIQLDDGYQADVGDWFRFSPGFPEGVAGTAREIESAGFQPGIWLAPLIAKPGSQLFRTQPDWLIRNESGRPANAGFVWNRFTAGLDVSHPGVQEFTSHLVDTAVHEWGYPYLKLDFLYAGVIPGKRHNQALTRAQALAEIFLMIRSAAGQDAVLLGCGCPLGSGVGVFDLMRIGADVAPAWTPAYLGISFPFTREQAFPSSRNAVRNTLARIRMHGRWWINDPDCIMLREQNTHLTAAEVQTMLTVTALSAGAVVVSDALPMLIEERIHWLSMILPPLREAGYVPDWFSTSDPQNLLLWQQNSRDTWLLAAEINWQDAPASLEISPEQYGLAPESDWFVYDFWNRKVHLLKPGFPYACTVQPHGTGLFVLRQHTGTAQWLGDTLHISQGGLIESWQDQAGSSEVTLDTDRPRTGDAWLAVPGTLQHASLDGTAIPVELLEDGVARISLSLLGKHVLRLDCL